MGQNQFAHLLKYYLCFNEMRLDMINLQYPAGVLEPVFQN